MPSCSFNKCTNHSGKENKSSGMTFHAFPKDKLWRHAWLTIVRKQRRELDWVATDNSRVCSTHFKSEDIYTTNKGLRKIKKGAAPSVRGLCAAHSDSDHSDAGAAPTDPSVHSVSSSAATSSKQQQNENIEEILILEDTKVKQEQCSDSEEDEQLGYLQRTGATYREGEHTSVEALLLDHRNILLQQLADLRKEVRSLSRAGSAEDRLDTFGKYVASALRGMSPPRAAGLQARVAALLAGAEPAGSSGEHQHDDAHATQ